MSTGPFCLSYPLLAGALAIAISGCGGGGGGGGGTPNDTALPGEPAKDEPITAVPITLSGVVHDGPIAGARVVLKVDGKVVATTEADDFGNYTFELTPDQDGLVEIEATHDEHIKLVSVLGSATALRDTELDGEVDANQDPRLVVSHIMTAQTALMQELGSGSIEADNYESLRAQASTLVADVSARAVSIQAVVDGGLVLPDGVEDTFALAAGDVTAFWQANSNYEFDAAIDALTADPAVAPQLRPSLSGKLPDGTYTAPTFTVAGLDVEFDLDTGQRFGSTINNQVENLTFEISGNGSVMTITGGTTSKGTEVATHFSQPLQYIAGDGYSVRITADEEENDLSGGFAGGTGYYNSRCRNGFSFVSGVMQWKEYCQFDATYVIPDDRTYYRKGYFDGFGLVRLNNAPSASLSDESFDGISLAWRTASGGGTIVHLAQGENDFKGTFTTFDEEEGIWEEGTWEYEPNDARLTLTLDGAITWNLIRRSEAGYEAWREDGNGESVRVSLDTLFKLEALTEDQMKGTWDLVGLGTILLNDGGVGADLSGESISWRITTEGVLEISENGSPILWVYKVKGAEGINSTERMELLHLHSNGNLRLVSWRKKQ